MTLDEFLLARIAEDHERAGGTGALGWVTFRDDTGAMRYTSAASLVEGTWVVDGHEVAPASGSVVHEERRVLAECEAKRRIVEWDPRENVLGDGWHDGWHGGHQYAMRLLALSYADHPDYDPAWRPA